MTTIEKIKQARIELDKAFNAANDRVKRHLRVRMSDMEALQVAADGLASLQAEALIKATEDAEESAAKIQTLSDQVQENERHIERLASVKVSADPKLIEIIEEMFVIGERLVSDVYGYELKEKALAALALAKEEAI